MSDHPTPAGESVALAVSIECQVLMKAGGEARISVVAVNGKAGSTLSTSVEFDDKHLLALRNLTDQLLRAIGLNPKPTDYIPLGRDELTGEMARNVLIDMLTGEDGGDTPC